MIDTQPNLNRPEARRALGISKMLIWFIPIGFGLMIASFFEGSLTWAAYVFLTGWWGIVMGLSGAKSLTRQFMEPSSAEAQASWMEKQLWGLFMFWVPTLSAVVLGGLIFNFLQDEHRPRGTLGQPLILFESLAMYFLAAGFAWTDVYREGRKCAKSQSVDVDKTAAPGT